MTRIALVAIPIVCLSMTTVSPIARADGPRASSSLPRAPRPQLALGSAPREQVVSRGADVELALRAIASHHAQPDRASGITLLVFGSIFDAGAVALAIYGMIASGSPDCEGTCHDGAYGALGAAAGLLLLGTSGIVWGTTLLERADHVAARSPRLRLAPRADGASLIVSATF